jgi:hypothetical protein
MEQLPTRRWLKASLAEIDKFETEIEYNRKNDSVVVRSPVKNIATKRLVPSDFN